VAGFYIDTTEVDVGHYAACVAAGRCTESRHRSWDDGPVPAAFDELCNARHPNRTAHPVNCVDKEQARAYCAFVGKRLPTEIEWEYAARGADGRRYPWGSEPPRTCETAVVSGLCARQPEATRAVGSRAPESSSPFGLSDQSGNVWEWVESPGTTGGVLKGGAWDYPAERATATSRLLAPEARADASTGFRCALSGRREQ
jgi:formylglycine-generating enzyme required for sulfatase activity